MKKLFLSLFILLILITPVYAKRLNKEIVYAKQWCSLHQGYIPKHPIYLDSNNDGNKTRLFPDCIVPDIRGNDILVVEFDHGYSGNKIGECVGQAFMYSSAMNISGECVLILEDSKDINRYNNIVPLYKGTGIVIDYITPKELKQ